MGCDNPLNNHPKEVFPITFIQLILILPEPTSHSRQANESFLIVHFKSSSFSPAGNAALHEEEMHQVFGTLLTSLKFINTNKK